jgi:uncharacterized membrane protein
MLEPDSGPPGFMIFLFVVFLAFIVVVFCAMIYAAVRRYRAAKQAGLDPWAGDIQMMGAAKSSALLAPARGDPATNATAAEDPKARIDRLNALLADGTITQDEYQAARQRIVDEL